MENNPINSPVSMHLDPPPLVYLHEHFKKHNIKGSPPLKNNWVWFDKEVLKAISNAIEQIGIDEPGKEGDGVRLYYGIYNDKVCEFLTKVSKEKDPINYRDYSDHKDHNTVFFVPTYEGAEKDEHIDCISKDSANKFKEAYKNNLELPHSFTGGFNVGHICPPPKNCDNSGSNL